MSDEEVIARSQTPASRLAAYVRGGGVIVPLITVVLAFVIGGFVVLLTPKAAGEEVDASDIDEAAVTAGLHSAGTFTPSSEWRAHKLVAPRSKVRR